MRFEAGWRGTSGRTRLGKELRRPCGPEVGEAGEFLATLSLRENAWVTYLHAVKRAEIQLPDPLYQQVEGLAQQLHLSVPELLRQAAEQMLRRQPGPPPPANGGWRFPEGRHLGPFRAPVEDWRLLANDPAP